MSQNTLSKIKNQELLFDWPVIGNENIVRFLQAGILNNRISQAYLLTGPVHIGKTFLLKNFVATLLCNFSQKQTTPLPCRRCVPCRQFFSKAHPDVYWLKKDPAKKNLSIEEIRHLRHQLHTTTFLNSYKFAILEEAETLTVEAANATLKILEEPAPKTIIILISSNSNKLPLTIKSRCQVLQFLPVATDQIFQFLLKKEVKRKKAWEVAKISFGKPGLAINFWQDRILLENYYEKLKLFTEVCQGSIQRKFKIAKHLTQKEEKENLALSITALLDIWTYLLRDLLFIKNYSQELIVNVFYRKELEELSLGYDSWKLIELLKQIRQIKEYLTQNINPKLTLENLFLKL